MAGEWPFDDIGLEWPAAGRHSAPLSDNAASGLTAELGGTALAASRASARLAGRITGTPS
jgi:hypothetical protein